MVEVVLEIGKDSFIEDDEDSFIFSLNKNADVEKWRVWRWRKRRKEKSRQKRSILTDERYY